MFRKMPFILLAMIILSGIVHSWIPLGYKEFLYGVSLSVKSLIVFILPFLIFGLLFKAAVQLSKQASKMIFFLFGAICLSNFVSTMISYTVGTVAYKFDLSMAFPSEGNELAASWTFALSKWIGNDQAMLAGLGLGIFLGWAKPGLAAAISEKMEKAIGSILKGFLYLIPFFIGGFVLKMHHDQVMGHIVRNYGLVFGLIGGAVFSYIGLIYLVASRGSFLQSLKNMMPAAIAGFGSMSSAAAMPLTLIGTEKNAKDRDLARAMIPATVNIHLIGDCFAIPIFAFAVMKSFGVAEPTFLAYLVFASYFVLAKFSVAAVPGGGILVMLPILESTLGFDPTMLSLITALYILFDPVITCANVLGNGGFAIAMSRVLPISRLQKRSP